MADRFLDALIQTEHGTKRNPDGFAAMNIYMTAKGSVIADEMLYTRARVRRPVSFHKTPARAVESLVAIVCFSRS